MTGQEDIRIRLENEMLEAQISLHGAELKSLKKKRKAQNICGAQIPLTGEGHPPFSFPL